MFEEFVLKHRVSALIALMGEYFKGIDTNVLFGEPVNFERTIKDKVDRFLSLTKSANDFAGLQLAIEGESGFYIQQDITDFLFDWSKELEEFPYNPGIEQQIIDFLISTNEQIFYAEEGCYSVHDISVLWKNAPWQDLQKARFIALLVFYVFTKAMANDEHFKTYLEAVEVFFALREYLLGDGALPMVGMESLGEGITVLKSLMTKHELHLFKTMTAAGGVAASLQKEDLEGGIANTRKKDVKETKEKQYNRIEKLEE